MRSKFYNIGIIFLVLLLCTACTKDEALLAPEGESYALKTAPVENVVITVLPSGVDDTQAIRDAFQAAKDAGPGTVVYLTEGLFHISEPIVVDDFCGILMGAGKDNTEIEIESLVGGMFLFEVGETTYSQEISISELSIRYNEVTGYNIPVIGLSNSPSTVGIPYVQVNINNLEIIGVPGQDHVISGIGVSFLSLKVDAVIEGCSFINVGEGIKVFECFNSTMLVRANHFRCCFNGIVPLSHHSSYFEIYNNNFEVIAEEGDYSYEEGVHAIYVFKISDEHPSQVIIRHNNLYTTGRAGAIAIFDAPNIQNNVKGVDVEIKSNNFNMDSNPFGIVSVSSKELQISNNKFSGSGVSAVAALWTKNMVVLGDNINALNSIIDFPYLLSWPTYNCAVVGNAKDNVLDLGMNNILTGVNSSSGPPGPVISEALENLMTIPPGQIPGW